MPEFITVLGELDENYQRYHLPIRNGTPLRIREADILCVRWWDSNGVLKGYPDYMLVTLKHRGTIWVAEEDAEELLCADWVPPKPEKKD